MTKQEMDFWLPILMSQLPGARLTAQRHYYIDGGQGGYILVKGAKGESVSLTDDHAVRIFLWAIELFIANYEA